MKALFWLLVWLLRACGWAALLGAVFFLLPLGVPYIENALAYHYVRELLRIDKQWLDAVRAALPTKFGGVDISRWVLVGSALVVHQIFLRVWQFVLGRQIMKTVDPATMQQAEGATANIAAGGVRSRAALLEIMAETKKKLESMQRDLAFLSIDVVGSTDMKLGEDKTQIEMDFRSYKKFIDTQIGSHGALTAAWTPDGVMICFPTADAAVATAQDVINGLQAFNKNVKKVRASFRVRCGVNAGKVYYDRSIPMEQMSDHIIDVAGHMQKYALPNTVALGKAMLAQVTRREGFKPTGKEVDGLEVYHWGRQ
ncbi:MAG: hypothetical protein ACREVG_12090 [Burkholderiales bacterium]